MKSTRSAKPKPATGSKRRTKTLTMARTKTRTKPTRLYRPAGSVAYPEARGKTLADLYLMADSEFNSITLRFDDNTEIFFCIDIESSLVVDADYSDWTTGNQRVLKRWPARR